VANTVPAHLGEPVALHQRTEGCTQALRQGPRSMFLQRTPQCVESWCLLRIKREAVASLGPRTHAAWVPLFLATLKPMLTPPVSGVQRVRTPLLVVVIPSCGPSFTKAWPARFWHGNTCEQNWLPINVLAAPRSCTNVPRNRNPI